jgi:uncharacterized SAM-binding protein YcdF (DUF218 family)
VRAVLLGSGAAAACVAGAVAWVDVAGHRDNVGAADVIIVPGTRVLANGLPSLTLRERVAHAVSLHKRGLAPFIICTGGVGVYPPSEGEAGARLAVKLGVPASQVLVEGRSKTTRQNLEGAARICRAQGWKKAIIVSQSFHLPRCAREARRVGLEAFTAPVPGAAIDRDWSKRLKWTLREVGGLARDVFRP